MNMNYDFEIKTIDDLLSAAGFVEDDRVIKTSGKQLKELASGVAAVRQELIESHKICTELGVPDLGGGTKGLLERLKWIKNEKREKETNP